MISNDATAPAKLASGVDGSELKSVRTLSAVDDMAYSTFDGRKTPASRVEDGATMRLVAPRTATSSRTV